MKRNSLVMLCVLMMAAVLMQCSGSKSASSPKFNAGDNALINYGFAAVQNPSASLAANVTGTISGTQVSLQVPYGTKVTSLAAEFVTNSTNVQVNGVAQTSGVTANDFTSPVKYSVYNNAGVNQDYTVTVIVAPSNVKQITSFAISGTTGSIDESAGAIAINLPPGTKASSLAATFSAVAKSVSVNGVTQTTGVTKNDFTGPVVYTAAADDGSTKNYTVTAKVLPAPWKDITSFSFSKATNPQLAADITGTISGSGIQLTIPFGSSPAGLIATFLTSGVSVAVNGTAQTSGSTQDDCARHPGARSAVMRQEKYSDKNPVVSFVIRRFFERLHGVIAEIEVEPAMVGPLRQYVVVES